MEREKGGSKGWGRRCEGVKDVGGGGREERDEGGRWEEVRGKEGGGRE